MSCSRAFPPFFLRELPDLKPESSVGYDLGIEQGFGGAWSGSGPPASTIAFADPDNDPTSPEPLTPTSGARAPTGSRVSWRTAGEAADFAAGLHLYGGDDDVLHEELLRARSTKAT